jgi:hypothetical protein
MPVGTSPNIPDFRVFGGSPACSLADGAAPPNVFYFNSGWYKKVFASFLFCISGTTVRNILLTPIPTSRGVLEVDAHGLVLTVTANEKFVRYPIPDYVMPAPGAGIPIVLVGSAADQQARDAIAALQARVGHLESEETADDTRDAKQAAAITALQVHDKDVDAKIAGLLLGGVSLTVQGMKDFLWNDHFTADLLYELIHNRKDAGLVGALKGLIAEVQQATPVAKPVVKK